MASLLRHAWMISGNKIVGRIFLKNQIQIQIIKKNFCLLNGSLPKSNDKIIVTKSILFNHSNKQNFVLFARLSNIPNRIPVNSARTTMMLVSALVVIVLGLSYAAVPLYRIYCQKVKSGGQAVLEDDIGQKVAEMKKIEDRKLVVRFEADKSSRLAWDFQPSQTEISCVPGETVLAFYTAKNQLDRPVNGIATYTILPYEAGKYFNKIQCFCFEEQQLNPNEKVDLPVFFYIDPEFAEDPFLFDVDDIVLSYNFFETKKGYKLPKPDPYRAHLPAIQQKLKNDTKIIEV